MRPRFFQPTIIWLSLAGYLLVALGGVAVVLCEGSDGHRGIELAHGQGPCDPLIIEHASLQPILQKSSSPNCQDTPLDELASAEPVPPRLQPDKLVLLPPPLLALSAWAEVHDDHVCRHAPFIDRPLAPSHLDALLSVVLLI